jgi:hypothetical protein
VFKGGTSLPKAYKAIRDPLSQDAGLAGERLALREATARARAKSAPEKAQLSIIRSRAWLTGSSVRRRQIPRAKNGQRTFAPLRGI